jgi:hypothetical protein
MPAADVKCSGLRSAASTSSYRLIKVTPKPPMSAEATGHSLRSRA